MKNKLAVVALIAAALGASVSAHAFQSTQVQTSTAGAFVGGVKTARFTLTIRDTSNPLNASLTRSSVTWTNVNAGDSWKIASQCLVLNSTVTDDNGGIQIYTDNTAADARPQFVDPTPGSAINSDSVAAGLLKGLSGQTSTTLPMAWSIKTSSKVVEGTNVDTGIGATDPNNGSASGANNRFQWFFMTDKANTAGIDFNGDLDVTDPTDSDPFVNGAGYISMVRAAGLHVTQGDLAPPQPGELAEFADGLNAFVYLQANFASASAQQAYQTTTLRVEAFIQ